MARRRSVEEIDLETLDPTKLAGLSREQLVELGNKLLPALAQDRQELQLYYYKPASTYAAQIHQSMARTILAGGGNGSGKSSTVLVEMAICATGVIPESLRNIGIDWKAKMRGPIRCRFVCQSITNTLHHVILPMLRWNQWSGIDEHGGDRGHWGWIPKACLKEGEWAKSWSEKYRTLTLLYRNPDNFDEVLGESVIQFMSHDQTAADMASADIHLLVLDEPPPLAIFRESQARTMRVKGRILMAMTWPDDPSINVDWIFDEIYEKGLPGPNKDPQIDYFEIPTTANRNLDQGSVSDQMQRWDERMVQVRILGKPIRFSNRVHELFTDTLEWFCFKCGRVSWVENAKCQRCESDDVTEFCHVRDFRFERSWPVVWVVDPHPRKPHMSAYFAILPDDTIRMVAELECAGDPTDLRLRCEEIEADMGMIVRQRLIDPRMAGNPSGVVRDRTWLDEFHSAGLYVDPADSSDVGREIFDTMLRPDPTTRAPRFYVHPRCESAILQFKRFMWDDWKQSADKDMKQVAKKKNDDFPAIARYFCNSRPSFKHLLHGWQPVSAVNLRKPRAARTAAPQFAAR